MKLTIVNNYIFAKKGGHKIEKSKESIDYFMYGSDRFIVVYARRL